MTRPPAPAEAQREAVELFARWVCCEHDGYCANEDASVPCYGVKDHGVAAVKFIDKLCALGWSPPARPESGREAEMKNTKESDMTEGQIKYMVNRFLGWKLPEGFSPDGGIGFKKAFNEHTAHPMKHEPSGTNLFDATQAEAMVRHLIDGLPQE